MKSLNRLKTDRRIIESSILAFLILLLSFSKLWEYLKVDFTILLALISLPFVVKKTSSSKSIRYGVCAILMLLVYPFLKHNSIFLIAIACALIFIFESNYGKINIIVLLSIVVFSPMSTLVSQLMGFEIRLHLTQFAASILALTDPLYSYSGNIILYSNNEFHVDQVCMGLKMVTISFFICLVIMAYYQRNKQRSYGFFAIIINLIITFVLVIISNLSRIILITLFRAEAGSFSHEFIGILCLIIYVVLPLIFIIRIMPASKYYVSNSENTTIKKHSFYITSSIILIVLVFLNLKPVHGDSSSTEIDKNQINLDLNKFRVSVENYNVIKMYSDQMLIYIKPPARFYSGEHSPMVCWKGSGYKIRKEQIIEINNYLTYYSELHQDDDVLHTCWWYESQSTKTSSQFRWRLQSLTKNEAFYMVNIICNDKKTLLENVKSMLNSQIMKE